MRRPSPGRPGPGTDPRRGGGAARRDVPDWPDAGPALRCGVSVIAGPLTRGAHRRRLPAARRRPASKAAHAAGSGVAGVTATARQPPSRSVSSTSSSSWSLLRDHQGKGVRAEAGSRGQRPGLGRREVAQDRQDGPPHAGGRPACPSAGRRTAAGRPPPRRGAGRDSGRSRPPWRPCGCGGGRRAGWRPGSRRWTAARTRRCTPRPPARVRRANAGRRARRRRPGTAARSCARRGGRRWTSRP